MTRRGRSDARKDTVTEDDQNVDPIDNRFRTLEDDATSQAEIVAQMAGGTPNGIPGEQLEIGVRAVEKMSVESASCT